MTDLRPIFIVGTPKSGTTFLHSLFDGHSNVLSLLESNAYRVFDNVKTESSDKVLNFYTHSKRTLSDIHPLLTPSEFNAAMQQRVGNGGMSASGQLLKTMVEVIQQQAKNPHYTHFIEKTPAHYRDMGTIMRDFPHAKVIHVLRDPRDNYLSLKRRMEKGQRFYGNPAYHPLVFLRNRIIASFEAAYQNTQRFPGQYRILFYEELLQGKAALVRQIVDWLELPWEDSLLTSTLQGSTWKGNSTDPELEGHMRAFDTRSVGKWKQALSGREVTICEQIIRMYALQEKYPLSLPTSPFLWRHLLLPFEGEIHIRQGNPITEALRFGRSYTKRRIAIYRQLTAHREDNNQIIPESFKINGDR